jgi:transposase
MYITAVSISVFKKWLYRGRKQRIPFAKYVEIRKKKLNEMKQIIESE